MSNCKTHKIESKLRKSADTSPKDVAGLNTIRFAAAMCVAFGHGALFPIAEYAPKKAGLWAVAIAFNNSVFNGVAAVLIFFVISGFCIHYSYACGRPFALMPFLSRRLFRIAIPAGGSLVIATLVSPAARSALDAVLWSLYYEMIYYLLYPLLRIVFSASGVPLCIAGSILISLALIGFHWDFAYYWQFPIYYGWLIPLPAWLFGCLLAEAAVYKAAWKGTDKILLWRFIGLSYAAFAQAYLFHGPIKAGFPILLYPFVVYSYFWMKQEIAYMSNRGAPRVLEWAGKWSYSIYLLHGIVLVAFDDKIAIGPAALWAVKLGAILASSYCFYVLIELPSHQFARKMSYWVSSRKSYEL